MNENTIICTEKIKFKIEYPDNEIEYISTENDYFHLMIQIKSGMFSGASEFCISKGNIIKIIKTLKNMHETLKGSCVISDFDSDGHITIEMQKLGHICISGQMGGTHQDHYMTFKFMTDQSILPNLIKNLKKAIS
ncbi:MAG: hypothetical protein V1855_00020 [bacterium]